MGDQTEALVVALQRAVLEATGIWLDVADPRLRGIILATLKGIREPTPEQIIAAAQCVDDDDAVYRVMIDSLLSDLGDRDKGGGHAD